MKCSEAKKLIYDYTKNETGKIIRDKLEKHLSTCKKCEKEYLETVALKNLFRIEQKRVPSSLLKAIKKSTGSEETFLKRIFKPVPVIIFSMFIFLAAGTITYNHIKTVQQSEQNNRFYDYYDDLFDITQENVLFTPDNSEESGLFTVSSVAFYE